MQQLVRCGEAATVKAVVPTKRSAKADTANLQGTWQVVAAEMDGLRIGDSRPEIKESRLVIDKTTFTMSYSERSELTAPNSKTAVADFKVDSKQTPKVIELTWTESPWNKKKDFTQRAIYLLEGDVLKLCVSQEDDKAPTEFSANFGSKQLLWTFRREKP